MDSFASILWIYGELCPYTSDLFISHPVCATDSPERLGNAAACHRQMHVCKCEARDQKKEGQQSRLQAPISMRPVSSAARLSARAPHPSTCRGRPLPPGAAAHSNPACATSPHASSSPHLQRELLRQLDTRTRPQLSVWWCAANDETLTYWSRPCAHTEAWPSRTAMRRSPHTTTQKRGRPRVDRIYGGGGAFMTPRTTAQRLPSTRSTTNTRNEPLLTPRHGRRHSARLQRRHGDAEAMQAVVR